MRNDIPKIVEPLVDMAAVVLSALERHGGALGFKHNTREALAVEDKALREAIRVYVSGRVEMGLRRDELEAAVGEAKAFATITRDLMKVHWGNQWSTNWEATPHKHSLAILIKPDLLQATIFGWLMYFQSRPEHQNGEAGVTLARVQAIFDRISKARTQVTDQKATNVELLRDRNEKFQAVRKRLRAIITELTLLIDPMDTMWKGFGLNRPGLKERPEMPEEVNVLLENEKQVRLEWKRPARAARYHVCQRKAGTEEPFVRVKTVREAASWVNRMEHDVDIAICAVNTGGESRLSEVIRISALMPATQSGETKTSASSGIGTSPT